LTHLELISQQYCCGNITPLNILTVQLLREAEIFNYVGFRSVSIYPNTVHRSYVTPGPSLLSMYPSGRG
jgi:hypothetical protein